MPWKEAGAAPSQEPAGSFLARTHDGLTTADILAVFTDEIAAHGGTVTDTFHDGPRLFTRCGANCTRIGSPSPSAWRRACRCCAESDESVPPIASTTCGVLVTR